MTKKKQIKVRRLKRRSIAARAFAHAQQLLQTFLDHDPSLAFIKDEQGRYLYANKSFLEFFRITEKDLIGKTDFDWLPKEVAQQFAENDARVRSTGEALETIEDVEFPHGVIRSLVHKFPIKDPSGKEFIGGTATDITERLKIEELQARARDQAMEASALKSAFVSNISHELRTPLTGILGAMELLAQTQLTEEQQGLVKIVEGSSDSLLSLVNDILDLSKIEAGKVMVDVAPFNLIYLFQDCARLMAHSISQKQVALRTNIDQRIPDFLQGDQKRLRQTLLNLIGNSIKFTESGEIDVAAAVEKTTDNTVTVRFTVKDTGIGISEEEQSLLFKPFSQVDNSSSRKYQGTGLGLYISKQLVELMGGSIGIESKKDEGTLCWFTVPFRKYGVEQTPKCEPAFVKTSSTQSDREVLVVDDHKLIQTVISKQLNSIGIKVQVASNGLEAVKILSTRSFDLVLMDCQMSLCDGFEATKMIRDMEAKSGLHTPVIALTAGLMQGDREKCLAAGMDDYLGKPATIQQLKAKIEQWVELKQSKQD